MTPWTVACKAPLSLGFPRQEYWSGLPLPSTGYLLNPGIEPSYPALAGGVSGVCQLKAEMMFILPFIISNNFYQSMIVYLLFTFFLGHCLEVTRAVIKLGFFNTQG